MGVDPPFIYDKPSSYTFGGPTSRGFNPRAATHASWTPKPSRPKQDGPLVNFNRHPDSYYQSPYGNVSAIPMNPNTKGRVKFAWNAQRLLRALALLGALGAVFCIVTIRKTTTNVGWIIRVGPSVALGHTLYATYFLCRSITSRAPASCASYQIFAGLLDTGLIPFFAISCYMATMDYTHNTYGWGTLFNDNVKDYKIIQAFMIICGTEGGLLLLSLVLDFYLAVIYRKINDLPPDMSPLEEKDNLTARPNHKRNKSELLYEKHLSSSTVSTQRFSQMSGETAQSRRVPFKHTRTDSADTDAFSFKKDFVNEFKDPYGARASMDQNSTTLSRPSSALTPAANARPAGIGLNHKPTRSSGLVNASPSRPTSWLSYTDYEGMPVEISDYSQQQFDREVRPMSPVSAMSDRDTDTSQNLQSYAPTSRYTPAHQPTYTEYNQENSTSGLAPPSDLTPQKKRSRDPLGMNPPTPVNTQGRDESLMVRPLSISSYSTPPRQALRDTDANSIAQYATPASRPASFVGSGTKSRFYGNLRNSLGGSPTRNSYDDLDDTHEEPNNDVYRSDSTKSAESGNFEVYASDSDDGYDPYRSQSRTMHSPAVLVGEPLPGHDWTGQQRQISNSTGYDLHAGYAGLDPEFGQGMARRREVSGKVAEEGRSYEISNREVEAPNENRLGAAGWARFKGL